MARGFERDITQAWQNAAEANRTAEQEGLARTKIEDGLAQEVALTLTQFQRWTAAEEPNDEQYEH